MFFFSIAFVLVLLSGSDATLPNIGKCTYMEYFCDGIKCNIAFAKGLQKDPKGDCSAKFNKLIRCATKTLHICAGDTLTESQIDNVVHKAHQENFLCFDGGVEVPTTPPMYSRCSNTYNSNADACMRTFMQKYAADKSDPALCPEFAKTKRCMKTLFDSDCAFSSSEQELLDLAYSDYNFYCADNRDPGATGNETCYGVKEVKKPLTFATALPGPWPPTKPTSSGIKVKISALQTLMFPFLFMFFVKI